MREKPKERHAKINFQNYGSPPVGLPAGTSPVTFTRDAVGNISAYVDSDGGAGSSESELWAAPATADAFDEEFTSPSLANFTVYDSDGTTTITPSGSIDPYASFSGAAVRVQANTYRRSWLAAQVSNDNAPHYVMKSWTPNTNAFIWARVGHTIRYDPDADDSTVVFMLMAATAGHPDPANLLGIWWVPNSGAQEYAMRMFAHKKTGGVGVDVFQTPHYIFGNAYAKGTYFGIQKRGTDYDFWVLDGIGTTYWLGTTSYAPTIAYAGFMFHDNTASSGVKPGNAVFYADFLRLKQNTSVFLP